MGTRNLTMVVKDNQTKIAQYAQWDGYPSGTGLTILSFLKEVDLPKFKKDIDNVSFLTPEEIEAIDDVDWKVKYPELSRDTGADILKFVDGRDLKLSNSEDFAGDSLMNEWTYVIDLDNDCFEVYEGFNQKDVSDNERFAKYNKVDKGTSIGNEYKPVKLKKNYKLNELPTEEQFISELEPKEE